MILAGMLMMATAEHGKAAVLDLKALLPDHAGEWAASEPIRYYDSDGIFDYIDGAGEVYRAYGLKGCVTRRYEHATLPSVVVDVFEMGSSRDAYGVFTHDRVGEPVEVGGGGLYNAGWFRFWKGAYYVSITPDEEVERTREALVALATAIAALIESPGEKPAILDLLPSAGLDARSISYFHDHLVLNARYYVADDDILKLSGRSEAAIAEYSIEGDRALLLIVIYDSEADAKAAIDSFRQAYMPEAGEKGAVLRTEDGRWVATAQFGQEVAVVFDAASADIAMRLLDDATRHAVEQRGTHQ